MQWLLLACSDPTTPPASPLPDDTVPETETPPAPSPEVIATVASSPFVEAVALVTIDGPAGDARVEWGLDDFGSSTEVSAGAAHHELALIGLKAGRSYQWRAIVEVNGATLTSATGVFAVPSLPPGLVALDVVVSGPEADPSPFLANYVLPSDTSFLGVVDRDGDWVWWVETDGTLATNPVLSLDGKSVLYNSYDFAHAEDLGKMVRVSLDGRSRTETRMVGHHHDFVEHDDETVAFLTSDFLATTPPGAPGEVTVQADVIAVGPEGMTDADVPERPFSMFEDYPLPVSLTCSHMTTAATEFGVDVYEWTHGNSLNYLADTDSYYLLQKFTDALLKIDRTTGEVDWVLNGQASDFTLPGGAPVWTSPSQTALWSHSHLSELWDGGGLMFDNGDHYDPPATRAIEFVWDEEAHTAEVVWEFAHPGGQFTGTMGDVRSLPNGDRLIAWANLGQVTEATPDGQVVWRADYGGGAMITRIVPLPGGLP